MSKKLWHNLNYQEVAKILKTDVDYGLSGKEAEIRQKKFGKNILIEEKTFPVFKIFFEQLKSPLIYILVIAGIVTAFFPEKEAEGILGKYANSIVIFGAVFLNTILGFFQESKTSKILQELRKNVKVKTYVIRDGNEKELEQSELVEGDIIILKAGNKVPADGRLIENHNLKINESSLTGEWLSTEKRTETLAEKISLADRNNMVYMGCAIEQGYGKAIVTEIGMSTEIGKISSAIKEIKKEKTPYQKKVQTLSKFIAILIVFISFFIFLLGILAGRDFFQMFLTAIAVAVAAVPEGLPVAITVILALGMQRILVKKGLVRKMVAAETLGSTSIIATDKTGTLTEAKMEVAGIYTFRQILNEKENAIKSISHLLILKIITLTSEAFIENPDESLEKWIVRGRPTDKALLMAGIQAGMNKKELIEREPKIADIPFDPVYKYSAVLHKLSQEKSIFYVIGAPEIILAKSKFLDADGKKELLNEKSKTLNKKCEELAGKGQRVLAAAYKEFSSSAYKEISSSAYKELSSSAYKELSSSAYKELSSPKIPIENSVLEGLCNELVFVGLVSLHDPIRKEVKEAIKICRQAGIRPIIVTGDHKLTAKAVAVELGITAKEENIIEGKELEELSDEEFQERLEKIEIYARTEPIQKLKIVRAWQEKGKVIAMTGDGINDAPALKQADIGLALGSGTDIAKDASDLILLTDNFSVIVAAIEEGRVIIDNIRKTVALLVSQCSSEIILIGASIIGGLPLPILPVQILWENLIEGSPQGIALAFEPKEKNVMERKPEDPKKPLLTPQLKTIIFGFGIFTDIILLSLFLLLLRAGLPLNEIRTVIFAALAVDTFFYAFSCRNLNKNIWQYNIFSNRYLLLFILFSFIMLLIAIYLPAFQNLLKTVPLDLFDWLLLLVLGIINLILIEATKWYFIKKQKFN